MSATDNIELKIKQENKELNDNEITQINQILLLSMINEQLGNENKEMTNKIKEYECRHNKESQTNKLFYAQTSLFILLIIILFYLIFLKKTINNNY
jgi:hypothetical protein